MGRSQMVKQRTKNKKLQLQNDGQLSNLGFGIILAMILLLAFLRNVVHLPIPIVVLLLVACIPAIAGNTSQMVALMSCCIPFSTAFQYKYVLLLCIVCYIIKKHGRIRVNHLTLAILLMMVWELLHAFYGEFSIIEYLRGFAELLCLLCLADADMDKVDHKLVLRALALCTIGVCATIFILQMQKAGWNISFVVAGFRFGEGNAETENFGLSFNPNRLGFICNLSMSGLLLMYIKKESAWYDAVMMVVLAIFGFLTLSRTYIVCLSLLLFLTFVATGTLKKGKLLNLFGMALVLVLAFLAIYAVFPQVFDSVIARFLERDITGGRNNLFAFYDVHIWSSFLYWFFGIGQQNFVDKITAIYGGTRQTCHNGFQQTWVAWGIVGVLLMIYLFAALFMCARKYHRSREITNKIPMILLLTFMLVSQFITSGPALLALVPVYVCLCTGNDSSGAHRIRENTWKVKK